MFVAPETKTSPTRWYHPATADSGVDRAFESVELPRARRRFRFRITAFHALCGLALGYGVLHPVSRVICEWFDVCLQDGSQRFSFGSAIEAFNPDLLLGAFAFAIFGLCVGAMDGYYRSLVYLQRDELARQLEINQAYRRELEDQNIALRELERMKRRMTQFLVHDLKNHVGCVLGYTNLLLKRARRNGWQQRDLDALTTVGRQATRMKGAVRDVLDLAKLEHQPQLELRAVPAAVLLREAMVVAAFSPEEGVARMDNEVPPDLVVDCDSGLIVRVMANLVVNAVRHNGEDVVVTIGAHSDPWSTVFTCTDTGHGIPLEIQDQLFDDFTSSSREDGMTPSYGLGLAFCKAAVDAHGGRIWFESQDGAGTTFLFSIPKREIDFQPVEAAQLTAGAREHGAQLQQGETTSWLIEKDISQRRSSWKMNWTTHV